MKVEDLLEFKLPPKIYRRFLIYTEAWNGSRAAPGSLLVKIYEGGNKLPLYWCGTPDTLPEFNKIINGERDIYCIPGPHGVIEPTQSAISALGKYFAAEIIKLQPEGPYLLGGFCQAGWLSQEIAINLNASGYQVGMHVLFDVHVTNTDFWLKLARKLFLLKENALRRKQQFVENPIQCLKEVIAVKWNQLVISPYQKIIETFKIKADSRQGAEDIVEPTYCLGQYPGDALFIYVRWGLLGFYRFKFYQRYWQQYVRGSYDFKIIEGSVHNQPNWRYVAVLVQDNIKKLGY